MAPGKKLRTATNFPGTICCSPQLPTTPVRTGLPDPNTGSQTLSCIGTEPLVRPGTFVRRGNPLLPPLRKGRAGWGGGSQVAFACNCRVGACPPPIFPIVPRRPCRGRACPTPSGQALSSPRTFTLLDVQREVVHDKRSLKRAIFRADEIDLNRLPFVGREIEGLLGIARILVQIGVRRQRGQNRS
jgi:hypothetical protein